ncbi:hypothetical protein SDC9_49868 [bioreactor metagenome]|uniref:Uncharacterized protein n=1 Tax=bioreactor metagenome TaxID=1076179 RepID=A0A644WJ94_9ZZZZ
MDFLQIGVGLPFACKFFCYALVIHIIAVVKIVPNRITFLGFYNGKPLIRRIGAVDGNFFSGGNQRIRFRLYFWAVQTFTNGDGVNIVQIVILGLGIEPAGGDELGDAPLHLRPRQIRCRAVRGHGEGWQIVAILGAQKCGGIFITGVFPHITDNGVLTFNIAVPFLNGGVNVGLGDFAPFRFRYDGLLRHGRHRESGGLFALRWRGRFFCSWFRWRWLY